ncbi:delta(3,5)-Delta(2,4)-dienoyl-CoA isomerase, mitochondrial [Macrobrachium rosenbergii]|uniref:delta(3,5)-Delta(2,4)-dienoyl-CoA isomerase, mitochondrial n=1 Tax=Macrobrachium rosenbergii TaxID=79674 RepID=UPI0034D52907
MFPRVKSGLALLSQANRGSLAVRAMCASASKGYSFETLAVTSPRENVYHVELNRPDALNAMNSTFWREVGKCFNQLALDPDCRAVVLSGSGRLFTSGLDMSDLGDIIGVVTSDEDVARKSRKLLGLIEEFQDSFSAMERCPKPVIAAIHSACVGGGVDLICSADIRYCTSDAWFQVKEVDIGLAADVGTLQRLPKIVGNESLVRELAFSARKVFAAEAERCGLVSRVFEDKESMVKGALDMAETIAGKSPVAVQNTKTSLVYARDHSVQEGLDYMKLLNMAMLQSEDLRIAAMAQMSKGKKKPIFSQL